MGSALKVGAMVGNTAVGMAVVLGSGIMAAGGVGVAMETVGTTVAVARMGTAVSVGVGKADCEGVCAHVAVSASSIVANAKNPDFFARFNMS